MILFAAIVFFPMRGKGGISPPRCTKLGTRRSLPLANESRCLRYRAVRVSSGRGHVNPSFIRGFGLTVDREWGEVVGLCHNWVGFLVHLRGLRWEGDRYKLWTVSAIAPLLLI